LSDLARPAVVSFNNILARTLEKREVFFLFQLDMSLFTWKTVFITVITFGLIAWLSLYFGRLFCNAVCPVGTSLGLLSRLSLFRISMDSSTCTRCGKCSFKCKSDCIDVKNMKVD
jgi:polyferredoxin